MPKSPSRRSIATKPGAKPLLLWAALFALTSAWGSLAMAAPAGQVTHLSGILSVKRADGAVKLLSVKSEVQEGDLLVTESESWARVKFNDGSELIVRPESRIKIDNFAYNPAKPEGDSVVISMLKGGLRAVTGLIGKRNREKITFQTETATIGIRGTITGMSQCGQICNQPGETDGIDVDVTVGAVEISSKTGKGKALIGAGKFGFIPKDPNKPPIETPKGKTFDVPNNIMTNKGGGRSPTSNKPGAVDCEVR